jgi:hypothetical protein
VQKKFLERKFLEHLKRREPYSNLLHFLPWCSAALTKKINIWEFQVIVFQTWTRLQKLTVSWHKCICPLVWWHVRYLMTRLLVPQFPATDAWERYIFTCNRWDYSSANINIWIGTEKFLYMVFMSLKSRDCCTKSVVIPSSCSPHGWSAWSLPSRTPS